MKTLFLDIETAPNLVYCWGIWDQNIGINQMVSSSSTICWGAKWLGEKKILFDSVYQSSEKAMVRGIHKLLDEADVVITFNGKKFDIPTLNKEFLISGLNPPSPYKQVDIIQTARYTFNFQSNKLEYIVGQLGLGGKVKHNGFELWLGCIKNDPLSWRRMEKYNKHDVVLLEKVYNKMLPWINGMPNAGFEGIECCPRCGSKKFQSRGISRTLSLTYKRYQCIECGGWFRSVVKTDARKPDFKEIV